MVSRDEGLGLFVKLGREVDQIVDRHTVSTISGWLGRDRLSWCVPFTRHAANFHRPLLDRPDRFSGYSIEYIKKALLARLGDGLHGATVDRNIDKDWRGGYIHIPKWVVHQLEVPLPLPGFQIYTDQTFAEQIVSRPVAPVKITCRGFDWQVNQPELLVHGDLGPHARVAGVFGRAVQPGVVAELAFLGDGVKYPETFARAHVEPAHVTFIVAHAAGGETLPERRAYYYRVSGHDRRRMQPNLPSDQIRKNCLIIVQLEIDYPVVSEGRYERSGLRVQTDEPIARGKIQDAFFFAV